MNSIVERLRKQAALMGPSLPQNSSQAELREIANDIEAEDESQKRWFKDIMDEKCNTDQIHCTCVPTLRAKVFELEAEVERLAAALSIDNCRNAG